VRADDDRVAAAVEARNDVAVDAPANRVRLLADARAILREPPLDVRSRAIEPLGVARAARHRGEGGDVAAQDVRIRMHRQEVARGERRLANHRDRHGHEPRNHYSDACDRTQNCHRT
jgi:hypothetical protein